MKDNSKEFIETIGKDELLYENYDVVKLSELGFSQEQIAKELGISKFYIDNLFKEY